MYLDAANTKSLAEIPTVNLISNNPTPTGTTGFVANGGIGTLTYDSPNNAVRWIRTSYETWGAFVYNDSLSNYLFDTGSTYTISFKWKYGESHNAGTTMGFEIVQDNGSNRITQSYALLSNSTLQSDGWYYFITSTAPLNPGITQTGVAPRFRIICQNLSGLTTDIYWKNLQFEKTTKATPFVNGSRTPTWTDLSKGGNNGTLTNNPTYDYSNGGGITLTNALNATGSSVTQRVIVPNSSSIQFTTGMSADIWFYANGSTQPSTLPRLLEKSDFYILIFQTLPSNLNFNVSSIAGGRSITSINSPITNTTRINVTTTYDGQISKIYINGVLNNTTDWGSVSLISPTSTDLSIGDNFGWVRTFNGTIYSTKLYNRALSAAEVLQNYNTTKSRFGL
jgi:hypothetical protein